MDGWKEKLEEYWKVIIILFVGISTTIILFVIVMDKTEERQDIDPYDALIAEVEGEEITLAEAEIAKAVQEILPSIILVDIKGSVEAPGVYEMKDEDRIIDVIDRAGGLTPDAESKGINFAQKVEDQMVIYIPKTGEEPIEIPINAEEKETEEVMLVNINEADATGLMTLNGIGPSKADSIIRYREERGFFQTIDDIKNVSGIGNTTFENLRDYITVSN